MNRPVVAAVAITALSLSGALVWLDARREAEYRRLLRAGDEAVARGQSFDAIEAFSGALVLKPGSMAARLKRGDAYRRRDEFGFGYLLRFRSGSFSGSAGHSRLDGGTSDARLALAAGPRG
jgi:hypothetical protein